MPKKITKKEWETIQEQRRKDALEQNEKSSTKSKDPEDLEIEVMQQDPTEPPKEGFKCSSCNAEVKQGDEKCGKCGEELDWDSEQE